MLRLRHPVQQRHIKMLQADIVVLQGRMDVVEAAIALLDRYAIGNGRTDDATLQLVLNTDVPVPFDVAETSYNSTIDLAAGTISLDIGDAFVHLSSVLDLGNLAQNQTTQFALQLLDDLGAVISEQRDEITPKPSETDAATTATFDIDDVPAGYKYRTVLNQTTGSAANIDIINYRLRAEWASRARGSGA